MVGRAQINKSGSEDIVSDPNIDGFGPKKAFQCDGDEGASSSSAIDFLTLCHSLKVCLFTYNALNFSSVLFRIVCFCCYALLKNLQSNV